MQFVVAKRLPSGCQSGNRDLGLDLGLGLEEIKEVPNGTSCEEPEKSDSTHSRCFAVMPSEAPPAAQ